MNSEHLLVSPDEVAEYAASPYRVMIGTDEDTGIFAEPAWKQNAPDRKCDRVVFITLPREDAERLLDVANSKRAGSVTE